MNKSQAYFKDICALYPTPDNDDPIVAKKMNRKTLADVKELIEKKRAREDDYIGNTTSKYIKRFCNEVLTELEKLKL